ncbi:hypothetical protein LX36DRAFT_672524 [Colletotrichum falcatum]|nr:hypothetical protein LX36DRAFT_672524 [Colletotrichum falcatum]
MATPPNAGQLHNQEEPSGLASPGSAPARVDSASVFLSRGSPRRRYTQPKSTSIIMAAPSSTELFLACTSAWQSASACSQFSGVTLTYGDGTMRIGFGSDSYDCKRGDPATCSVGASGSANAHSVLASSESAAWFTAITIVDGRDKLKSSKTRTSAATSTGPAPAAATSAGNGNGVCKRTTRGSGSDGGSSSGTKPKGNGGTDGCSAASGGFGGFPLAMAAATVAAGVLVAVFL